MFFYHLKTAKAVSGAFNLITSSNSAVPKSRVARKSVCEHISRCLELVTDKAKSQKPSSHCVFWIFCLLRFCTCRLNFLCHLAECQAKLNVAFKLSGVKSILLAVCGLVKLEKSEFNRSLCKGCVEVEHMVSTSIVMVTSAVVFIMALVPYIGKL